MVVKSIKWFSYISFIILYSSFFLYVFCQFPRMVLHRQTKYFYYRLFYLFLYRNDQVDVQFSRWLQRLRHIRSLHIRNGGRRDDGTSSTWIFNCMSFLPLNLNRFISRFSASRFGCSGFSFYGCTWNFVCVAITYSFHLHKSKCNRHRAASSLRCYSTWHSSLCVFVYIQVCLRKWLSLCEQVVRSEMMKSHQIDIFRCSCCSKLNCANMTRNEWGKTASRTLQHPIL